MRIRLWDDLEYPTRRVRRRPAWRAPLSLAEKIVTDLALKQMSWSGLLTFFSGSLLSALVWLLPAPPLAVSSEELALYPMPLRLAYPPRFAPFDFVYCQMAPTQECFIRLNLLPSRPTAPTVWRGGLFAKIVVIVVDFFFILGYSTWFASVFSVLAGVMDGFETFLLLTFVIYPHFVKRFLTNLSQPVLEFTDC